MNTDIIKSFLLEKGIILPENWLMFLQFVMVKTFCGPVFVNLTPHLLTLTLLTFL